MVALAYLEADECPGCRGRMSETTRAEDAEDHVSYTVPPPKRCHKCTALEIATENYKDVPQHHALFFHAEPREGES